MSTIRWLRSQRDRPIAEHERRAAMVAVVVLLGATALLLTLTQPLSQARRVTPHTEQAAHNTTAGSHPGGVLIPEAQQTAEWFLTGYLAYTYGHSSASQIKDASRSLIRSLESQPARVPPAARARRPRVITLHPNLAPTGEITVSTVVNDGELIDYTIGLTLAREKGRLLVSGLEGA